MHCYMNVIYIELSNDCDLKRVSLVHMVLSLCLVLLGFVSLTGYLHRNLLMFSTKVYTASPAPTPNLYPAR